MCRKSIQLRRTHLYPCPLHEVVEGIDQGTDLDFFDVIPVEVLLHMEHAAYQQRCINQW